MNYLHLRRTVSTERETLGKMQLTDDKGCIVMLCNTLELPWLQNKSNVSCIPKGEYEVVKYQSPSKGEVLLLKNVPGRSYVEIHSGNYYFDTEGCIIVGKSIKYDINGDGVRDITDSRETLENLIREIKFPCRIHIL